MTYACRRRRFVARECWEKILRGDLQRDRAKVFASVARPCDQRDVAQCDVQRTLPPPPSLVSNREVRFNSMIALCRASLSSARMPCRFPPAVCGGNPFAGKCKNISGMPVPPQAAQVGDAEIREPAHAPKRQAKQVDVSGARTRTVTRLYSSIGTPQGLSRNERQGCHKCATGANAR